MPHPETIALSGVVRHVFAHRFTLEAGKDVWLADLGPRGAELFELESDAEVTLAGELRPSEIKVTEIARKGEAPVAIHHKKPHHGHGPHGHGHGHGRHGRGPCSAAGDGDPALALRAAQAAGWTVKGDPVRKPSRFEVLARQGQGPWAELHVDLDGGLYKVKALPPDGGKWAHEVG